MTLTYSECRALKEAGYPQEPTAVVAGGIDGEIHGGQYLTCRVEGECGEGQLTADEWQKLQVDDKYYTVKMPTLEELIEHTRKDGDKLTFGYIKGFVGLELVRDGKEYRESGSTPIQAVAKLYLATKKV